MPSAFSVWNKRVPRLDSGPPVLVVMGVSGSGKSTVAKALALLLGWSFKEGDSLHPATNIAKMHAGVPLTDADRQPWLYAVAAWIDGQRAAGLSGIITCSALKRAYRDIVVGDRPEVRLVYLRGSPALIAARLAARERHFMPPSLLPSQIETLEEPGPDEDPLIVEIGPPPDQIAMAIAEMLTPPI
jgi:carbohydrate kinase (thermoresistant glucokinase family)